MSPNDPPDPSKPAACDDLKQSIAREVATAFEGRQSDEDALVNIDEILGAEDGAEPSNPPPTEAMLQAGRNLRFAPSDDPEPQASRGHEGAR
jgi:hypothetical protein